LGCLPATHHKRIARVLFFSILAACRSLFLQFFLFSSSWFDLLRAFWVWGAKMPLGRGAVIVVDVVAAFAAAIAGGTQHIYGQWVSP